MADWDKVINKICETEVGYELYGRSVFSILKNWKKRKYPPPQFFRPSKSFSYDAFEMIWYPSNCTSVWFVLFAGDGSYWSFDNKGENRNVSYLGGYHTHKVFNWIKYPTEPTEGWFEDLENDGVVDTRQVYEFSAFDFVKPRKFAAYLSDKKDWVIYHIVDIISLPKEATHFIELPDYESED